MHGNLIKKVYRLRDKNKRSPPGHNRERMVAARSEYESLSKRHHRQHETNETEKLMAARFMMWNIIGNCWQNLNLKVKW